MKNFLYLFFLIPSFLFAATDYTWTLYCLTPATVGNVMVIPKRHIERFEEYTDEELLAVKKAIHEVTAKIKEVYGVSEYVILQKNGKEGAGQSVLHSHFHIISAPIPFDQIIDTAFHFRKAISDEEMMQRTTQLRQDLKISNEVFALDVRIIEVYEFVCS